MSDKTNIEINRADLAHLERDLNRLEPEIADATELFARVDLREAWIEAAERNAAIASGNYVSAIESQGNILSGAALRDFVLGNDVGYASIVEFGRTDANYRGKRVVQSALDFVDAFDIIEERTNQAFNKSLK